MAYRDREKQLEAARRWHRLNKERAAELNRAWAKSNPERRREIDAKYRASDGGRKNRERKRREYVKNRDAILARNRRRYFVRTYGLSPQSLDELIGKCAGRCHICLRTSPRMHVDHNHASGKVRGYLCHACNLALGYLRDDIDVLLKAIDYLRTSE